MADDTANEPVDEGQALLDRALLATGHTSNPQILFMAAMAVSLREIRVLMEQGLTMLESLLTVPQPISQVSLADFLALCPQCGSVDRALRRYIWTGMPGEPMLATDAQPCRHVWHEVSI